MKRNRDVNARHLLTGTTPPESISIEQLAERARRCEYQPRHLAKELGLNRKTFQRRFQRAFGSAPGRWFIEQRIRYAAILLERGLTW